MGFMDWFKKKEPTEADIVVAKIQMIDAWIIQNQKNYRIQFDTTVPMEKGRRKELSRNDWFLKQVEYEEKIEKLFEGYEIDAGLYDLYEMHKWMQVFGTTMFWLISFAPSMVVKEHVMLTEAIDYFYNIFMRTEPLCKEIQHRLKENLRKWNHEEDSVFEDYQDAENCEKLMMMILQLYDYFDFLLRLAADIYSNAPYLLDAEENYLKIENVEKTFSNIFRMIHAQNRECGCITQEQFMELIE